MSKKLIPLMAAYAVLITCGPGMAMGPMPLPLPMPAGLPLIISVDRDEPALTAVSKEEDQSLAALGFEELMIHPDEMRIHREVDSTL